ncbi:MAG TPA: T9SS type A sorting domain-containing protein [Cyclobacteriaceae bacterium]|nr:T9SS type A sorting domain-containing protein [Cyclobacteriaceae bacterium]
MSKSFMVFSTSVDDANPTNALIGGEITNATTLTFTRDGGTTSATIKWQVFEFVSGVSVQHGSTGNVGNATDVTLTSAVNLSKSFVIATERNDGAQFGNDDSFSANLTTTTNLRLSSPGGSVTSIYWQVVQYDDATVQKISQTLNAGSAFVTATIPVAVNVNKTMVISNHTTSGDITSRDLPRTELTNGTTLTFNRAGTGQTMGFVAYVIEFTDQTTVAHGSTSFASTITSTTPAINASLTGSGIIIPGNQARQGTTDFSASDNVGHVWYTAEITKPKEALLQRATASNGGNSAGSTTWQIVTFENEVRTYYSRATGDWENPNSWSLSSDGSTGPLPAGEYPSRVDNVVIRSGHTITVNNVADNYYAGVKPDDLGQANIGNSFESSNIAMFYHTGNILVTGALTVTGGVKTMLGGYTKITGSFTTGSTLVNTGYLEAEPASTLSTFDDLILTGNSITIINTNSTSSDDLIIDHTNATLCGTGVTQLQNGLGSEITFANGGTIAQVCTTFTVTCSGSGCPGTFPTSGTTAVVVGNTGPGGVGNNTGTSQLKMWYRVDNGVTTAGSLVGTWANSAGIAANNVQETGSARPTLVANAVNGFSEVSFDGTDDRLLTAANLVATNFVTDKASSFSVVRADNTTQQSNVYSTVPLDANRFANHIPWAGTVYFDIGTCCATDARLDVSGLTGLTSYSIWSYTANAAAGKTLYRNGTSLQNRAGTSTFSQATTHQFGLGGAVSGAGAFAGDMTEIVIYNEKVNDAERIIIDNYLSAKYNIAIANDVYSFDASVYDYDVAGIGRAADGSYHLDSRGTGIVRMWSPTDLGTSEFLLWGHDNQTLNSSTTTVGLSGVDGTVIKERLRRVWVAAETGEVGNVTVSFDISALTSSTALGNNLRLLIDRDHDGFGDNDVTPISGFFSNNIIVFSGVNFTNGDFFTLGNTDNTHPLPIELLSFKGHAENNVVELEWTTANEINNDYFTVLRSSDGEKWKDLLQVKGAGNSNQLRSYQAFDVQPLKGLAYYRLKQTDFDGMSTLSKVISVNYEGTFDLVAWPNPSPGQYSVNMNKLLPEQIRVLNSIGQVVPFGLTEGDETKIDISAQPAGVYLLQITDNTATRTIKVVKN